MPGAGKKRGKIDKKNGSGPAATTEQPPAAEASFDGPPPAGRGRPVDNPIPSGSRDISVAASAAGPLRDPARDAAVFLNRNVDFAGNAYNLINKVSVICSSETVCCPSAGSTFFFGECVKLRRDGFCPYYLFLTSTGFVVLSYLDYNPLT